MLSTPEQQFNRVHWPYTKNPDKKKKGGDSADLEDPKLPQALKIAQEIAGMKTRAKTASDWQEIKAKAETLARLYRPEKGKVSPERAVEIMGKDFLGPEAVKKAFGIELKPEDIPAIPFSEADLEKAKNLGQFLVLRADKAPDGLPLTMLKMHELLQERFTRENKGKVLYDIAGWKKDEDFFKTATPEASWALTAKEFIPDSTGKNYLAQTELITDYLRNRAFDKSMPREYQEAIDELDSKKDKLRQLLATNDRNKYEPELSKLKINRLCRQSPAEAQYDILMYFLTNDERLLENVYTWTHASDSDRYRVNVGYFYRGGLYVYGDADEISNSYLGVVFSRKF
jgi:hypothetical protein